MNLWIEHGVIDDKRLHIVGKQLDISLMRFVYIYIFFCVYSGHSLGGQMSGYIGKMINLLSRGSRKVKRITALDPAKPLFYINRTAIISYIHKDDAEV